MANTTPPTGNTPTGDAAKTDLTADSKTGTATTTSVEQTETKKTAQSTPESEAKPGEVWAVAPTVPEAEKVDEAAAKRAQEEDALRRKNPNAVVYRKAEAPSDEG